LDDQVVGQILGLYLAAFLLPKPKQRSLVVAHNYPSVGTADEETTVASQNALM
jgi:hypothetical protein